MSEPQALALTEYPIHAYGHEYKVYDLACSTTVQSCISVLEDITLVSPKHIVDIGAHTGLISFFLAKKYPQALITAYEPVPINQECFKMGVRKNGLTNIQLVPMAIGDKNGDVTIHTEITNTGCSSAFNTKPYLVRSGEYLPTTTKVLSLDDVISSPVDFLKIDVEGMEFSMLIGFKKWHLIKKLALETHENMFDDEDCRIKALLEVVKEGMGDKPYTIDTQHGREANGHYLP